MNKTTHGGEYNSIQREYGGTEKQTVGVEGFFERGSELLFLLCEGRVFWGWGGERKKALFGTMGKVK